MLVRTLTAAAVIRLSAADYLLTTFYSDSSCRNSSTLSVSGDALGCAQLSPYWATVKCNSAISADVIFWQDPTCTQGPLDSGPEDVGVVCSPLADLPNIYQTTTCVSEGNYTVPPPPTSLTYATITTYDVLGWTCDPATQNFGVQSFNYIDVCVNNTNGTFSAMTSCDLTTVTMASYAGSGCTGSPLGTTVTTFGPDCVEGITGFCLHNGIAPSPSNSMTATPSPSASRSVSPTPTATPSLTASPGAAASGLSGGTVTGIVAGAIGGAVLAAGGVFFLRKWRGGAGGYSKAEAQPLTG